jgi:hypothetical protein
MDSTLFFTGFSAIIPKDSVNWTIHVTSRSVAHKVMRMASHKDTKNFNDITSYALPFILINRKISIPAGVSNPYFSMASLNHYLLSLFWQTNQLSASARFHALDKLPLSLLTVPSSDL